MFLFWQAFGRMVELSVDIVICLAKLFLLSVELFLSIDCLFLILLIVVLFVFITVSRTECSFNNGARCVQKYINQYIELGRPKWELIVASGLCVALSGPSDHSWQDSPTGVDETTSEWWLRIAALQENAEWQHLKGLFAVPSFPWQVELIGHCYIYLLVSQKFHCIEIMD